MIGIMPRGVFKGESKRIYDCAGNSLCMYGSLTIGLFSDIKGGSSKEGGDA